MRIQLARRRDSPKHLDRFVCLSTKTLAETMVPNGWNVWLRLESENSWDEVRLGRLVGGLYLREVVDEQVGSVRAGVGFLHSLSRLHLTANLEQGLHGKPWEEVWSWGLLVGCWWEDMRGSRCSSWVVGLEGCRRCCSWR